LLLTLYWIVNVVKKGSKKVEIRVFVPQDIDRWIQDLVEKGELGNTKSEVIRTFLRDIKRGLIK